MFHSSVLIRLDFLSLIMHCIGYMYVVSLYASYTMFMFEQQQNLRQNMVKVKCI